MAGLNINTKLLFHFNGQNNGKEIIDEGTTGHIVSQVATAGLNTITKQFGSSSLLLDGNSDYIQIPDSNDWDINGILTEDWTISFFVKHNSFVTGDEYLVQISDANNWYELINVPSQDIRFIFKFNGIEHINISGTGISDNNWHHVALIKIGGASLATYAVYLDGNQISYGTTNQIGTISAPLDIGASSFSGGSGFLDGYLDEYIIEKSNLFNASPNVGLTDTIIIPIEEYIPNSNTKLLLHMNSHDISGDGGSNIYNIPTFAATAKLDTSITKFGSASIVLDGNSDYITIPDSTDWDIFATTTEDWTIDCFFRTRDNSILQHIVSQGNTGDSLNRWEINLTSTNSLQFRVRDNAGFKLSYSSDTIIVNNDTWYHMAFVKIGTTYAMYFEGNQVLYAVDSDTLNFTGSLVIGHRSDMPVNNSFNGWLDEFRIQKSNIFNASPDAGKTDTITVPTEEHDVSPSPSDDGFRWNKFFAKHEYIETTKTINLDKFTLKHYKNYDKD